MKKSVVEFLIRAKRATYAGKGAETDATRPRSHDLAYREGNLLYYDSYLGGNRFAGEEALWIDDVPRWSMNYAGRVTGEAFSGDFLKQALLRVPEDMPFRGPLYYEDGDYVYRCAATGGFDWFQGRETILCQNVEIYECFFHGGRIE